MSANALWHPIRQHKPLARTPMVPIVSGDGCYLTDENGKQYLDAIAGVWCVNVGYGREELAQVSYEQMKKLGYLSPGMTSEPTARLANKLLQTLGMDGRVYFTCSGSESNEAAFKIAWQYHQQSGEPGGYNRKKIISRYRAYHGNTLGALSATGQAERRVGYGLNAPGFIQIPPPYPYRRDAHLTEAEHGTAMAQWLDDVINFEGAQTVAAFLMEPMISGGGVLIPPDTYIPKVREVCDKHGVLLIFDEVVSGFGRTGTFWGHQHWNAKPDIVTCAKGIASGYQPLGATIVNQKIFDAFLSDEVDLKHFRHINTYGGHPVATAVALKNIEIIEREGLVEHAAKMGAYMLEQLEDLVEHPYIGDVRGRGLLVGIEMVNNKETKEAIDPKIIDGVLGSAREDGVILIKNGNTVPSLCNIIIISPPLTINEREVDQMVGAIKRGLMKSIA
jgi:adenosylmethionine-8-amino-7-oxononanoate aminotransferase